jgi:hypothetical protein
MKEISEEAIKEPQPHFVLFTVYPQHELKKYDATDDEIELAVLEAELLKRVVEDEQTPFSVILTIRSLIFGSCLHIAKSLETHTPDETMVRDIYPYARIASSESVERLYDLFLEKLATEAPEIYKSFFGGQEDEK